MRGGRGYTRGSGGTSFGRGGSGSSFRGSSGSSFRGGGGGFNVITTTTTMVLPSILPHLLPPFSTTPTPGAHQLVEAVAGTATTTTRPLTHRHRGTPHPGTRTTMIGAGPRSSGPATAGMTGTWTTGSEPAMR